VSRSMLPNELVDIRTGNLLTSPQMAHANMDCITVVILPEWHILCGLVKDA
jgi:hypothetical protein